MARTYGGVESFYGGGGSSFEPDINNPFVGYRLNPAQLGFSTNPMTPDQLGETLRGIRAGAKVIEVNLLRVREKEDQQVPIQHFQEIKALSKLTGVKPSVHGPLVDAAGFAGQGVWSEEERANNERIMFAAVEKAKIADPNKNIPVVFHSSNMLGAGTHYGPGKKKDGIHEFKEEIVHVFDQERKQLIPIKERERVHFGQPGEIFNEKQTIDATIRSQNNTAWENEMKNLAMEKKHADDALSEALSNAREIERMRGNKPREGFKSEEEEKAHIIDVYNKLSRASTLQSNNRAAFDSMFEQAYKYGSPEQKKLLKEMSDEYRKEYEEAQRGAYKYLKEKKLENDPLARTSIELSELSGIQNNYFTKLREITAREAPEVVVRGEDFAIKEAAKTFGNVAARSYKELGGDSAPMLAIENVWNGAMFSRGKDMKKVIVKSREAMVDKLVEDGVSRGEAKKAAEKLIGMNFDVGHLNMFRAAGFETKDIVKEVKEFAPYVKHMHITDNFGFSDEHLYPGQGNVPFKELFKELKKGNPNFDENTKKIIETGGIEFRHMGGRSAHAFNLAAFGVPIFGGVYGGAPTFDASLNTFGNYFSGYGDMNPEIHHSLYGAGFSNLPSEFGGPIPGMGTGRSRFGGAPMA